jgi:signal transduction histidine kinase
LAISKKLVDAMGGELLVSSVKGEGSQFALRVPSLPV